MSNKKKIINPHELEVNRKKSLKIPMTNQIIMKILKTQKCMVTKLLHLQIYGKQWKWYVERYSLKPFIRKEDRKITCNIQLKNLRKEKYMNNSKVEGRK